MTERIDWLRRNCWMPIMLIVLAVITIGARGIAEELAMRPLRERQVERKIQTKWNYDIANTIETGGISDWHRVAMESPELLVKACLTEIPKPTGESNYE